MPKKEIYIIIGTIYRPDGDVVETLGAYTNEAQAERELEKLEAESSNDYDTIEIHPETLTKYTKKEAVKEMLLKE